MIRFHDQAVVELNEAVDWYRNRSVQAAEKFKLSVSNAVARIEKDPGRFGLIFRDYRYARVVGFPYLVVYQQRPDHVKILALAHTSRREHYWSDRA